MEIFCFQFSGFFLVRQNDFADQNYQIWREMFFQLGCLILGERFGARGDLFPNLIGELFRAPESSKSQGSQFSGFFLGGGKNDLATKTTRWNISTKENVK